MNKDRLIFAPPTNQYEKSSLEKESLDSDPLKQFNIWYNEAVRVKEPLPESCTLATASLPSGRVSARIVLFKELDLRGFIIYSNFSTSKKNGDIRSNPKAALTFFWKSLERQVRIEGTTEFISTEESVTYFRTRPRDSRLGAWASPQSQPVESRDELESKFNQISNKFQDIEDVPLPENWGGLRIIPEEIEFWQGRHGRLHDRFVYRKVDGGDSWKIERLAP
ncbi:hypothetical protein V1511DRAFT_87890 [Dipodascopsis uninucleata]